MLLNCGVGEDTWESIARRSNWSILKEISPRCSLEGLMLKLKLQYFGHLSWLIGKDPDAGKGWGQEEKGTTEDEMVGWHHWLDGHGFGWTLGVGDGQGGLACCDSWDHKELDTIEQLNWTQLPSGTAQEKVTLFPFRSRRTSLVALWLTFHTPNAGGLGSIPGQGTRYHMLQLDSCCN